MGTEFMFEQTARRYASSSRVCHSYESCLDSRVGLASARGGERSLGPKIAARGVNLLEGRTMGANSIYLRGVFSVCLAKL